MCLSMHRNRQLICCFKVRCAEGCCYSLQRSASKASSNHVETQQQQQFEPYTAEAGEPRASLRGLLSQVETLPNV